MRRWRNRQKCIRRGRDTAEARQDRVLIRPRIQRHEEETILRARLTECATLPAISREQTRGGDRLRTRQAHIIRFVARRRVICSGRKILLHTRLRETTTVLHGTPSRRAGEKLDKTGSASRSTTMPR